MSALLAELKHLGVHVTRLGDQIKLRAATPPPADVLARLREHKAELLNLLPDAQARPVVRFRVTTEAWATALGPPGLSVDALVADLRDRWPNVEVSTLVSTGNTKKGHREEPQ